MSQRKRTPLFRARMERNPYGKGFRFTLQLRKGAGYRAFDLPGYSNNIAHPIRIHLYIPGVTLTVATNQRHIHTRQEKGVWISLRKNGNGGCVPAWW